MARPVYPADLARILPGMRRPAVEKYDIGDIYMSTVSTSPAEKYGGTWERIAGRFLLGATDDADISGDVSAVAANAGTQGGYKDAVTVSHRHAPQNVGGKAGRFMAYNYGVVQTGMGEIRVATASSGSNYVGRVSSADVDFAGQDYTDYAGVSGAGRNVPPYLAVYVWQRVA